MVKVNMGLEKGGNESMVFHDRRERIVFIHNSRSLAAMYGYME